MSATSFWSSGKPISTQAIVIGALIGTSTTWCGLPPSRAISLGLVPAAAWAARRSITGLSSRSSRPLAARRVKSGPSRAVSVAPMRAPELASAETMVSSSRVNTACLKA